ncbi:zinc-binding dehydrogenase [Amycolatopsis rubida]|uniref:Zinc-binding dehydrogenase n=1 Tax=Amycolatopsis rubida TaxID=112413 RepID=A0ABX0C056_9PSEU|nr:MULTISPECIES: zinc-binding dehydrogenase [Amycolatopsis]MYW96125.1 zinc-binding dehydrogenase [Amycolatopsis rubida]NEC61116.1 zinc-binding dehydrogenase [Amycolatopsis rubida]OAP23361.1 L-threonine 3-dehydrogenase [Amycolatopsis sp. M39]
MRGVVFTGDRGVELRSFPDPEPGPGEVVVRIRASGMCGSDLHTYRAPAAAESGALVVQGHEPCGEIHAVGPGVPVEMAKIGDRVMIHHYWGCGTCPDCRTGWPQMCSVIEPRVPTLNEHGGHAEFIKVPALQTIPLPPSLSFKAGAAIGCGTGTAWGGIERLGNVSGRTLVVFGQGPVGASATMIAAALGARVIAVDVVRRRLDAAEKFDADTVLDATAGDVVEAVRELTGGRGAELAIETSGVTPVAKQALDVLAPWGKACFIGIGAYVSFNTKETLRRQLTILTSWTLSTVQQIRCAEFVVSHGLPVDEVFSHTWSLDDAVAAYEWFDQQRDGKGVFVP